MNSKNHFGEIPLSSAEFEGRCEPLWRYLRFQYYEDELLRRGGIKFNRVAATRTRPERRCKALGIRVFGEAFYGTKAALINTIQKLPPGAPVMSLKEARSHIVAVS